MLVQQGALGFEIWTGEKAPLAAMKQAIRKAFSEE
jgi:shikimate 5-dehydrogenase